MLSYGIRTVMLMDLAEEARTYFQKGERDKYYFTLGQMQSLARRFGRIDCIDITYWLACAWIAGEKNVLFDL